MTKTAAPSTISPLALTAGEPVLFDGPGLRALSRVLNLVTAHRLECHLSINPGPAAWDDYAARGSAAAGASLAAACLSAYADTSVETVIKTDIWVDRDGQLRDLTFGVECHIATGDTVTITAKVIGTVGTASAAVTCTSAHNNTERTGTITIASATNSTVAAAGEFCQVQITAQTTSGSGVHYLRALRLEEQSPTIPDPEDN